MNKNSYNSEARSARISNTSATQLRLLDTPNSRTSLPGSSSKLELEPILSRSAFAGLKQEWDSFISKTQTPSPANSWDYLDVWWDVYVTEGYQPHLYVARDSAGGLVGAVPLMISQKGAFNGSRSSFRHLSLMGGLGELAGGPLELPACRGYEAEIGNAAAELILESLQGMWDVLYLYLVPHNSRSTNAMIKKLAMAGIPVKTLHSTSADLLPVTSSWNDYIQNQPIIIREEVRTVFEEAIETHSLELFRAGMEIPLERAYEELIRLSKLSNPTSGGGRSFGTPEMIDFHWKLAPRLIENDSLFFGLIKMDGKFVGGVYDIINNGRMWACHTFWDPEFEKAEVQKVLNIWSDKAAHDLGLKEIDYLPETASRGEDRAHYNRPLNIYEAACPKSMGGALFSLARGIDRFLQKK